MIFFIFGCVDRIYYPIPAPKSYGLSISGHINDQPGPYRVSVFRNYDVESQYNIKTGITAKSVVISDAEGNAETLTQVQSGIYETSAEGIRGKVGGIYKVTVELKDGRVYESVPDTLLPGGVVNDVHYKLLSRVVPDGVIYEFWIYANSSVDPGRSDGYFIWNNKTTYKAKTDPFAEYAPPQGQCYMRPDGVCNFVAPCSGFWNAATGGKFDPKYVGPCECCICWYDMYNKSIVINDSFTSNNGVYRDVLVDRIEMTGWMMMYKMRFEISMQSLSPRAGRFWKALNAQRNAVNNLFQPATGAIPGNFQQLKGSDAPIEGIFYSSSVTTKEIYVLRGDVNPAIIPSTTFKGAGAFPCNKLAPNATTVMPDFWID